LREPIRAGAAVVQGRRLRGHAGTTDEICVGTAVGICAMADGIYAAVVVRGRRHEGHAGRRGPAPVHREETVGWKKKMRERREVRKDERQEAVVFITKIKVGDLLEGLRYIFSPHFEYGCEDESFYIVALVKIQITWCF
jgi:hypothetical protein